MTDGQPARTNVGVLLAAGAVATTTAIIGTVWLWPMNAKSTVVEVSQKNRTFAPDFLTVDRGTIVHIKNDDTVTHHVYIDAATMKFDSGEQKIGTAVEIPFNHSGTFHILCAIHPTMHLNVVVK